MRKCREAPGDTSSHFRWNRGDIDWIRTYYAFKGVFVCPNCKSISSDFDEFRATHYKASAFSTFSKKKIAAALLPQRQRQQRGGGLPPQPTIQARAGAATTGAGAAHNRGAGGNGSDRPVTRAVIGEGLSVTRKGHLENTCTTLKFTSTHSFFTVLQFILAYLTHISKYLTDNNLHTRKLQVAVELVFTLATDTTQTSDRYYSRKAEEVTISLEEFLRLKAEEIDGKIEQHQARGSGWVLSSIKSLSIVCSRFVHFCRRSGRGSIETPDFIKYKYCTVNVKDTDNLCFLYSILVKSQPANENKHRKSHYVDKLNTLNYKLEDFPMKLGDVDKFERANPNLAIDIIRYTPLSEKKPNTDWEQVGLEDDDDCYLKHPCFDLVHRSRHYHLWQKQGCSREEYYSNVVKVDLLIIFQGDKDEGHYLNITNKNTLLNSHASPSCPVQIRGHLCEMCLRKFYYKTTFEKHRAVCLKTRVDGTVYTLPDSKQLIFSDWHKTIPPKFVVYADFESILPKVDEEEILQIHKPIAAGSLFLKPNGVTEYSEFFGGDCVVDFLMLLEQYALEMKQWYDENAKHPMIPPSDDVLHQYYRTKSCYLCKGSFSTTNYKVKDHDHFTGAFLGAACNKCNLSRRIRKPALPVVFHNLRGYDMHHIIKYAVGKFPHWDLQVIAQSSEKFQALIVHTKNCSIKFIDSLQFLHSSIANLSNMLDGSKGQKRFTNSLQEIPVNARDGKGIFPYSYATSQIVLEEPRASLPDRETGFYDTLAGGVTVSEEEYATAQSIWEQCQCQNLKDYMLIYLKTDVHLLADIFETFRQTAISEDQLEPLNFSPSPVCHGVQLSSLFPPLSICFKILQCMSSLKRACEVG